MVVVALQCRLFRFVDREKPSIGQRRQETYAVRTNPIARQTRAGLVEALPGSPQRPTSVSTHRRALTRTPAAVLLNSRATPGTRRSFRGAGGIGVRAPGGKRAGSIQDRN